MKNIYETEVKGHSKEMTPKSEKERRKFIKLSYIV